MGMLVMHSTIWHNYSISNLVSQSTFLWQQFSDFWLAFIPRLVPSDQKNGMECMGIRVSTASKQFRTAVNCVPDDCLLVARRCWIFGSKSSRKAFVL